VRVQVEAQAARLARAGTEERLRGARSRDHARAAPPEDARGVSARTAEPAARDAEEPGLPEARPAERQYRRRRRRSSRRRAEGRPRFGPRARGARPRRVQRRASHRSSARVRMSLPRSLQCPLPTADAPYRRPHSQLHHRIPRGARRPGLPGSVWKEGTFVDTEARIVPPQGLVDVGNPAPILRRLHGSARRSTRGPTWFPRSRPSDAAGF
jgi:hypothetical protein